MITFPVAVSLVAALFVLVTWSLQRAGAWLPNA